MSNPYYVANGTPSTGAFGASAPMRAEFSSIEAGFALLPQTLTANKAVVIDSAGTGMTVTAGSLALAGNFTTTGNFAVTLAASAAVTLTLPAVSGTLATLAGTETLSNKTLVAPLLGTPTSGNLANCTGYPTSGLSGALPAANFPALTGDITTTAGSLATTRATVATGATTGSSTAIPVITFNNKGLVTAVTTAAVVAPAGTLTGTTLAATVVTSSLTAVGTIATGTWQGGVIAATYGGTGLSSLGTGVATFLGTPSSANLAAAVTDETGSGSLVFATSPVLVTPNLGTPSSVTLTNGTGLPISTGVSGLAAGIATFLATPSSANLATAVTDETGSGALVFATSPVLVTPNLGTPSAITLTNATSLPISTGVSGLGTGVATFLATPSSANLATAVTDETGSGALVFGTAPTLSNPVVGTQSAGDSSTKAASTAFVQAATAKVYTQVFTATGTYTPHAGMVNCIIEVVGGGGGGGGIQGDVGWISEAAGGGAGSYARKVATAADIGASKAVTIGAGGAGGTAGANNGTAGGDTSVGVLCIGKGGSGGGYTDAGVQTGVGGLGGVAGTGGLTPTGASGGSGWVLNSTSGTARGAPGGSSYFGGGGVGAVQTSAGAVAGSAATTYGSGGGGGASLDTAAPAAGGAGSDGVVIITEYCNQ